MMVSTAPVLKNAKTLTSDLETTMTKDSPMARENRARVPSSCVPTDAQRAASQAFATQFDRLREETDELLKLKRAAQQMLATRPASQFDSLCHLLDSLLPRIPR